MRYLIMHKTEPRWEAGESPDAEMIAKVGAMVGDLAKTGALLAGEGLRASSLGARVRYSRGAHQVTRGPFTGENELPAGFLIVRASSLDEAVGWAKRLAETRTEHEVDVRPVTEGWDIGMAPEPPGLTTRRYMLLEKATAESEAGTRRSPKQHAVLQSLLDDLSAAGALLGREVLAPSRRGRRFKFSDGRHTLTDGPFAESKELIAGYVLVEMGSLDEAADLARRYGEVVGPPEIDVREVEDDPSRQPR